MSDHFWLSEEYMARLELFSKSRGKHCVEDQPVLSRITFINRNALRWRDAPKDYGTQKTLYNLWKRWNDEGIFARMMVGLVADHDEENTVMIDTTHLKADRTASSLAVKR